MTRPDRFLPHDPRIEDLERLLALRAAPFGGFGLEQLDGYLTAVALAPGEAIGFAEWSPAVWGKVPPRWENADDTAAATALLMLAHATAVHRVRTPGDDWTLEQELLWWLPDDPDADYHDAVDIGAAWGGGFLDGMALRDEAWDAWIASEGWIADIEAHLEALAVGSYPPDNPGGAPVPLRYRERLEIHASLPDMLNDLHQARIHALTPREPLRRAPTPGRNDPCHCGSGRKFKKCHGAG